MLVMWFNLHYKKYSTSTAIRVASFLICEITDITFLCAFWMTQWTLSNIDENIWQTSSDSIVFLIVLIISVHNNWNQFVCCTFNEVCPVSCRRYRHFIFQENRIVFEANVCRFSKKKNLFFPNRNSQNFKAGVNMSSASYFAYLFFFPSFLTLGVLYHVSCSHPSWVSITKMSIKQNYLNWYFLLTTSFQHFFQRICISMFWIGLNRKTNLPMFYCFTLT